MYRTNPNPGTDPWVITGAMKVNRILTRAEQADLVRKAGREPQQIQEGDVVTDETVSSINQQIASTPKFSLKQEKDANLQSESLVKDVDNHPMLNAIHILYTKGKDFAAKLFNMKYFDVAKTPDFMKEVGLTGDKFTVRYGVMSRHFGKDGSHNFTEEEWQQLPEAIQKPFAISKLSDKKDGYRIYTTLQTEKGEYVVVGADVKNAGRNLEVNSIATIFGRRNDANLPKNENVIYKSKEITPEQMALLSQPNSDQYPSTQELSAANLDNSPETAKENAEKVDGEGQKYSLKGEKDRIVADAKANGTYMLAPNGMITKLDAEQWATVRTDNFKKWFGDWENDPENASKVVDENGEPMVVFHYTEDAFTEFGNGKEIGKNTFGNATNAGYAMTTTIGHWFTTNKKQPSYMGKPMELFLNIREPYDGYTLEALAERLGDNYISMDDFNAYEEDFHNVNPLISGGEVFKEEKEREGHDGVVIDDEEFGGLSYVAFHSNQIKSAENNNGDFSADNNDIRYSQKNPFQMSDNEKKERGEKLINAPAIDVESGIISKKEGLSARKAAEQWWNEKIGKSLYYNTEIGRVEINGYSIKESLAHRYSQAKLDAIISLPKGFENAVYLGTLRDFVRTRDNVQNHYFAYPINYDGKRSYVFCRVMQDTNKNRLYVHEVFIADKIEEGNTLQTTASKPHGGIALYKDILTNILSAANLDNFPETAKENAEKFSLKDDKTLAGVHNISEEKLRKALKLGGFANPSVAVIDTKKEGDRKRAFDEATNSSDNIRFSLKQTNDRFNEELEEFKNKTHRGLMHLGQPSPILKACGVNVDEITLSPSVLYSHLKKHNLTADDLKGLVMAMQKPILVYLHGEHFPNIVVVTELDVKGGKLSASLKLNPNGEVVEVSNISSIHSKEAKTELERLYKVGEEEFRKSLRWVEKGKVLQWLAPSSYEPSGMQGNKAPFDIAKVLKDFENPSVSSEKSSSEPKFSLRVDQYQHDLAQWKRDNNLTKDAERPAIPQRNPGESAVDFANRIKDYRRQMALWKTAPQYEQHFIRMAQEAIMKEKWAWNKIRH